MKPTPWCGHCGSRNHKTLDCSKRGQTYQPTEADLAELEAKAAKPARAEEPARAEPREPEPVFEPEPRWPGAPRICTAENLPAFESLDEMAGYRERYAPENKTRKVWTCAACGLMHYLSVQRAPAGETSGNARSDSLPKGFVPFTRKVRPSAFGQEDLQERYRAPEPAKPAPRPAQKKKEGDLF